MQKELKQARHLQERAEIPVRRLEDKASRLADALKDCKADLITFDNGTLLDVIKLNPFENFNNLKKILNSVHKNKGQGQTYLNTFKNYLFLNFVEGSKGLTASEQNKEADELFKAYYSLLNRLEAVEQIKLPELFGSCGDYVKRFNKFCDSVKEIKFKGKSTT